MRISAIQLSILKKCAARKGLFAQEIGMPVKQRSTAYALVRKGLAEWASCQYPSNLPAIRLTYKGRAALCFDNRKLGRPRLGEKRSKPWLECIPQMSKTTWYRRKREVESK